VLLAAAAYLPSLGGGFLWDDDSNVTENPNLRGLPGLALTWASPFANQQYYPLTHTSFWIEYQLWSAFAPGYRVVNVLLHGLAAVLLWRVLVRLRAPGAWVAAAVFALHPVHVESVAWITERKNTLSGALYFGAMLAFLSPRGRRWLPHALFAAAMLAKTAVVTLPVALAILVWYERGRLEARDFRRLAPMAGVGVVLGLVTAWVEQGHVGARGADWALGLAERIQVAGRALWFYASKIVWPAGLNFIYPRFELDPRAVVPWLFPTAAVALPVVLWGLRGRLGRAPLAAALYVGVTLSPALGFVSFYFQLYSFVQDHFQYLASAGSIALLAGWGAWLLRGAPRPARVGAAALVLAVLGGMTWHRSTLFTSNERLWTATLARNPAAWMADINLGILRESQGRLEDAARHFTSALATPHARHDQAHTNLAIVLERLGRPDEARQHYEQALAANPRNADALNNLGNLRTAELRLDEAVALYRQAVAADPRHSRAHSNLGHRLADVGRTGEAEVYLREAARLDPTDPAPAARLGRLLGLQGRHAEAVPYYEAAVRADPGLFEEHYHLGLSLEGLGRLSEAENAYRRAIALQPDLTPAHNNLAIVLYHLGRYDEAWEQVRLLDSLGAPAHPGFVAALSAALPRPGSSGQLSH